MVSIKKTSVRKSIRKKIQDMTTLLLGMNPIQIDLLIAE